MLEVIIVLVEPYADSLPMSLTPRLRLPTKIFMHILRLMLISACFILAACTTEPKGRFESMTYRRSPPEPLAQQEVSHTPKANTVYKEVHFHSMSENQRPPKSLAQVELFHTQRPSRAYRELGILTYRAGTAETYSKVTALFEEKAAQIGADGVIMMGSRVGPSLAIGEFIATLTDFSAMAIEYVSSE
jgi:hypothetical protein